MRINNQEKDDEHLKIKIQSKRQEKELETLKKKIMILQKEFQEKELIEKTIYIAELSNFFLTNLN